MPDGIQLIQNFDAAIVFLHEIYGINPHMQFVGNKYHSLGYDVYCPNMLDVSECFSYAQQEAAYAHFAEHVGFGVDSQVTGLAQDIRKRYKRVFLMGFSVGATLAWISAGTGLFDGAVCYYGSRIREYRHSIPHCPVLLLFAAHEVSFSPEALLPTLAAIPNVQGEIVNAKHGFCDPFSSNYDAFAATKAEERTLKFLRKLQTQQQ